MVYSPPLSHDLLGMRDGVDRHISPDLDKLDLADELC